MGDVSRVIMMDYMFRRAKSFNRDVSNWDVSSVTSMDNMFRDAKSFNQKLCGAAWVHSKARKDRMFEGSSGSISQTVCKAARQYVTRRPIPGRELILRTPITTLVSTPTVTSTIANAVTCRKCDK